MVAVSKRLIRRSIPIKKSHSRSVNFGFFFFQSPCLTHFEPVPNLVAKSQDD